MLKLKGQFNCHASGTRQRLEKQRERELDLFIFWLLLVVWIEIDRPQSLLSPRPVPPSWRPR